MLKKWLFIMFAHLFVFVPHFASASADIKYDNDFLLGVLFEAQELRDKAIAEIKKLDLEILKNEQTIQQSKKIISLAQQKNDAKARQAEVIAKKALMDAQDARRKNEKTKIQWELNKMRADKSYATIHNMLSQNLGSRRQIKGFVTDYTGRVDVFKANGDKTSPEYCFLEPGDKIWTYGESSSEIQIFDGRATAKIGPYSEFMMRKDTPQEQVVELIKGKIYMSVDKIDDYAKTMNEKLGQLKNKEDVKGFMKAQKRNAQLIEAGMNCPNRGARGFMRPMPDGCIRDYLKKNGYHEALEFIREQILHIPTAVLAVRGTKYTVEIKDGPTSEINVLEGSVEVSNLDGKNKIIIDSGYKLIAGKDGISEPQKMQNIEKWWVR